MLNKNKSSNWGIGLGIFLFVMFFLFMGSFIQNGIEKVFNSGNTQVLNVLASSDNKIVEDELKEYALKNNIDLNISYMGDIDIVDELNSNSKGYDAVWISNSMWLYMLDNMYLTSNSKSISISPVVFGIKKSKAKELGLVDKNVTNKEIVNLIKDKKIKYVMNSVTQTNSGATAFIGFLQSLAGNPEVLTEEMLNRQDLINNLKGVFSGVERVSGSESYLEEMFLNTNDYEAVITSESSLININKKLEAADKEPLYLIYPTDGVAINDSTFAFINHDNNEKKEEAFLNIQGYLLSKDGQKMLQKNGLRTWYGGVSTSADKNTFNKDWGIDTSKYLNVTRFPSKKVISSAINLYIDEIRKPTHVVFCLDYSGSMDGRGKTDLVNSMEYILDYEKAKEDRLQFSKRDKITIIPFASNVLDTWTGTGRETNELIQKVRDESPSGSTALYAAIAEGIDILEKESDTYTKTIIAMTDGLVNVGYYSGLESFYKQKESHIPIYSITFGSADETQLKEIASLSNAKVFDGTTDLLKAFKEVRSYN